MKNSAVNFSHLLKIAKGVDVYEMGIAKAEANSRGFMSAYHSRFIMMNDGMNAMLPGAGLSPGSVWPISKEDIDRIEVILGPSSALYGPNAHNGLVNIITKHPRYSKGGTAVLGVGSNSILTERFRYAGQLGGLSYKINLENFNGTEWDQEKYFGFDMDGDGEVLLNEKIEAYTDEDRKVNFLHLNSALYFDFNFAEVASGYGYSNSDSWGTSNLGLIRFLDVGMNNSWIQLTHDRFFARFYNVNSKSGRSHQVFSRAGTQFLSSFTEYPLSYDEAIDENLVIDNSGMTSFEIQSNVKISDVHVIFGMDIQNYKPNSQRTYLYDRGVNDLETVLIDNGLDTKRGKEINISQRGLYGQVQTEAFDILNFTAAFRFDFHPNYGYNFSPRLAILYKGLSYGNFRVTYNKAFQAPSILQQYAYYPQTTIETPFGLIPVILRGGLKMKFSDGVTIDPLKPETNQTIEFGFKGMPLEHLFVDVNVYQSVYENFISTPQIMNDPIPVELGGAGITLAEWAGNDIPWDYEIVMAYQNFGKVIIPGMDVDLRYQFNENFDAFINFSWVDDSDLENQKNASNASIEYASLYFNTPKTKSSVGFNIKNSPFDGLWFSTFMRNTSNYDFVSGIHRATSEGEGIYGNGVIDDVFEAGLGLDDNVFFKDEGPLGGYTTIDLNIGYQILKNLAFTLNFQNLTDQPVRQMVGSPPVGRLIQAELKYSF